VEVIRARGRFRVKFDDKGRFPLPARIRDVMNTGGHDTLVMSVWDGRVIAFSVPDWENIEDQVAGTGPFAAVRQDAVYAFFSRACEATLDKNGRLRLPPELLEMAGLGKEVVVLAMFGYVELWDPERLDARERRALDNVDQAGGIDFVTLARGNNQQGGGEPR